MFLLSQLSFINSFDCLKRCAFTQFMCRNPCRKKNCENGYENRQYKYHWMILKNRLMPFLNILSYNIHQLYHSSAPCYSQNAAQQNWYTAQPHCFLHDANTDLSRRRSNTGKNPKLMDSCIHRYCKRIVNN